jgi:hypothetical protein
VTGAGLSQGRTGSIFITADKANKRFNYGTTTVFQKNLLARKLTFSSELPHSPAR